ncbi:hypothetical protein PROFUN_14594 [Planoprotostelium fungivorum]|uniref:Uncharacterized protein n=1 Tax=Planoprotostelium fungivorum TaxID=1890364 RepID=A0A2P6MZE9_9EUKA|nr:hypothetical protein PROFUN_14594 [Planoprotostelium fungivorum]
MHLLTAFVAPLGFWIKDESILQKGPKPCDLMVMCAHMMSKIPWGLGNLRDRSIHWLMPNGRRTLLLSYTMGCICSCSNESALWTFHVGSCDGECEHMTSASQQ